MVRIFPFFGLRFPISATFFSHLFSDFRIVENACERGVFCIFIAQPRQFARFSHYYSHFGVSGMKRLVRTALSRQPTRAVSGIGMVETAQWPAEVTFWAGLSVSCRLGFEPKLSFRPTVSHALAGAVVGHQPLEPRSYGSGSGEVIRFVFKRMLSPITSGLRFSDGTGVLRPWRVRRWRSGVLRGHESGSSILDRDAQTGCR